MRTMLVALTFALALALPAVENGSPAPDFTLPSAGGTDVALSSFKGKYVVLEWVNFDCPFVKKHYHSANMSALQEKYGDATWLSINSSAPGKQGHLGPDAVAARLEKEGWKGDAYLFDESGAVGKAYSAKTTPHIFIVDPEGKLIYQGAIDSISSKDQSDVEKATNYVVEVLEAAMNGQPVPTAVSKPYGCSVKYAD